MSSSLAYCLKEQKPCVGWVEKYFKDCLCNAKDEFSFGFGLISLVCWGVAEIPQIITNFRTKSSHGVSLLFLLTWVAGDIFNLVGCLLEPATLPTQYYTAVLYTTSTVVLVLQGLYYDHIFRWIKSRNDDVHQEEEDHKKPLKPKTGHDSGIPIPSTAARLTAATSPRREYYYTSARSLAGSGTSPFRSYLRVATSGPPSMGLDHDSSSDDERMPVSSQFVSQPRAIPRSVQTQSTVMSIDSEHFVYSKIDAVYFVQVGYGTFLATSANLPLASKGLTETYVGFTGRRILQEGGAGHSAVGQWLGWLMAAIYMGGRIPQIWLNIKRGSVEGLNPLMFIFALVANLTYVLSIVVRTTEWDSIRANMPWLLDAVVCVALDLFIILQYVYYKFFRNKRVRRGRHDYDDYMDATKPTVY